MKKEKKEGPFKDMEHAWNETQEEDPTTNEENVAMGMAQINYKRSLAPTFSNMTIQLIDQCEKQNRLVNSMKSGTKLLAIWERGLFACFVAQYRLSLDFSKLSDIFSRCLKTDLWAAWQQQN